MKGQVAFKTLKMEHIGKIYIKAQERIFSVMLKEYYENSDYGRRAWNSNI